MNLKKTLPAFALVLSLVMTMGVAVAGNKQFSFEPGVEVAQDTATRYLVKSNNGILKMMYEVNHNFDKGFTTGLTSRQVKVLGRFGIKVEKVELYQITEKPVCGDGIIEGGEKYGEQVLPVPELPGVPVPGVPVPGVPVPGVPVPGVPERSCTPDNQTPWGVEKVNGSQGGTNIKVAVLDTGVDMDHLDLKNNIIDCKDTTKLITGDSCADGNGHGTHVAGTILADGGSDGEGIFGVAPKAKLMAIKVCGPTGCWADDIATGIRYATDNGVNIISMSLGGDTQSSLIGDAIDYATDNGVLVIAAAGNDGPGCGSIDYPAANAKVVAVGAINSAEAVPDFSSRGVNNGDYIIGEREVEFGAPGVSVLSTWNNGCYNTISGTSMATPHVAGLAAKLWDTNAVTTRTHLQDRARLHDLHTEGDDTATGFGLPIAP